MVMRESLKNWLLGLVIILAYLGAWIGSGYFSWILMHPNDFWSAVLFVLVWGVILVLIQFVGGGLLTGLLLLFENRKEKS